MLGNSFLTRRDRPFSTPQPKVGTRETGRGNDTIFYEQLRNGRAAPSYERSTETGVTLALAGGEPNLGLVRLLAGEGRDRDSLSLEDLLLLTTLAHGGRMTALDAAAVLQREEVAAQDVLRQLAACPRNSLARWRGYDGGSPLVGSR